MSSFGVGGEDDGEDDGEAKPAQEENEFLADELDALSVPRFDFGDGFYFTLLFRDSRFDAPAFAVEPTEVGARSRNGELP